MTAEVGVLNRLGVALAADSAVSIGQEANKIWTSADKLFHLSRSAPVGIMVYGNANFVGVPWEAIVKAFRVELGDTRYDRLEGYADRFFRFLSENRTLFPTASQDFMITELIKILFHDVRNQLQSELTKEAEQRDGLDEDEIAPVVDRVISERLTYIRSHPRLQGFGKQAITRTRSRFLQVVRQARAEIFGNLPIGAGTSRKIASIAHETITRHYFAPFESGVVIAGFGEKDAMPSLYSYAVEEMAANRPRRRTDQSHQISIETTAAIVPFAQQEIVHAFLRGVDDELATYMRDSTSSLFKGAVDSILDAVRRVDQPLADSLGRAVRPEVRRVLTSLFEDWNRQTISHWGPIVDMCPRSRKTSSPRWRKPS